MVFWNGIFPRLGEGTNFLNGHDVPETNKCLTYWWSNLLFINNLYPWRMGGQCIGWVWYLANDFLFFLISPLVVYLYCKSRKHGYLTLGGL